uniref:Uncharacterized protein n=1 Tax=Panagrolaimus sp. JU765 TaxID=591449 RepID=A0AC34RE52_9BILA
MNSHGMFRVVHYGRWGDSEKFDVPLYDIYYFEITEARIRNGIIMLLINTMEESFAMYVNFESILVPLGSLNASAVKFSEDSFMAVSNIDSNLYHAHIHYDDEVTTWRFLEENVTEIHAVKIFDDEILVFTKYEIKRYSCLKVFIAANGISGSFYWVRITRSGEIKSDSVHFGNIHEFEKLHGEYDNKKVVLLGKTENITFVSFIHWYDPTAVHSIFLNDSYVAKIVKAGVFSVKRTETHVMWSQVQWENVKNGKKIKYQNLMKNDGIEDLEISDETLVIYTTYKKCSISIQDIIDPYLAPPEEDYMKNNCTKLS